MESIKNYIQGNPWIIIGGVTLIFIVIHFLSGNKSKTKASKTKTEEKKEVGGLTPITSFLLILGICVASGLPFATFIHPVVGLGAAVVFLGIFTSGKTTINIAHAGVVVILGMRTNILLREGVHFIIPRLMRIEPVDLRERVIVIPREEEKKEGFEVTTGVTTDNTVNLYVRAVLKFEVDEAKNFLSVEEKQFIDALTNAALDQIRSVASKMSDKEFISQRERIAEETKEHLDGLYSFINVNSVSIPKAVYKDNDVAAAKQERAKEKARTDAQRDEFVGEGGTLERIEQAAARLHKAGMPADQAAAQAVELVQSQEGRLQVRTTKIVTSGSPVTDAAALLADSLKPQPNTTTGKP